MEEKIVPSFLKDILWLEKPFILRLGESGESSLPMTAHAGGLTSVAAWEMS